MKTAAGLPGWAAAAAAGASALLMAMPGAQGQGLATTPNIPNPNIRTSCTPRCADMDSGGQWRCDTTDTGERLCNTQELLDPHRCHLHFYSAVEVAECLAERENMVIGIFGGSVMSGVIASVFPWMDQYEEQTLDVHDWLFDGQPPYTEGVPQYVLEMRCAAIAFTADEQVTSKKASLDRGTCGDVFARNDETDAAPGLLWGSSVSAVHVLDYIDQLIEAERTEMSGYFVLQIGTWYNICNNPTYDPWGCNALPDGEEVKALRSAGLDAQLEFYYTQMASVAEKIRDNFPNIITVFSQAGEWTEFMAGTGVIATRLAQEYNGMVLDVSGVINSFNSPEKVGNHPVHIASLGIFQRIVSVACEADQEEEVECEEQSVGSPGCNPYEWSVEEEDEDDTNTLWWNQHHRPCVVDVYPSAEMWDSSMAVDAPSGGGEPLETLDFSRIVLDREIVSTYASPSYSSKTGHGSAGQEYKAWKYTSLKIVAAVLSLLYVIYTFKSAMPKAAKTLDGHGSDESLLTRIVNKILTPNKAIASSKQHMKRSGVGTGSVSSYGGSATTSPSKAMHGTAAAGAAGAAGMGMGAWGYLTAFDGARFVASQHIVGGHYFGTSPQATPRWYIIGWGFTWVPWFMMLSGFVLTYSSLKRQAKSGQVGVYPNPWTFLQARVKSIYPLYLLGLIAAFFVSVWDDRWQNITWLEAVASVTLTQAWIPKITENVLQAHCWFLSAIVPLWFFHGRMEKFMSNLSNKALVALMVALSVAGWLPAIIPPIVGEPADWYRVHSYGSTKMWEDMFVVMLKFFPAFYAHVYIYGIGLACLYRNYREAAPALFRFGACIGYAGLLLVFTVEAIQPPGYKLTCRLGALAPLQGLILIGLAFGVDPVAKLFNLWPFRVLGRYSYSVYIFQFIAFNIWSGWADMGMMTFLLAFAIVMLNVSTLLFPTKDNSVFWRRMAIAGGVGLGLVSLWGMLPTTVSGKWGEDTGGFASTPAYVEYSTGATDVRLNMTTSNVMLGDKSEFSFINPSLLTLDDTMFMAARRHRMEFDTTPEETIDGAKVITTMWYSDIVLSAMDTSAEDGTLKPMDDNMHVMYFTPSEEEASWTPCIPEMQFHPINNTWTQHVVTGPQDPRLFVQDRKLRMSFFSTLPNQPGDACPATGETIGAMFVTDGDLRKALVPGADRVTVASLLPAPEGPTAPTPQVYEKNWMAFDIMGADGEMQDSMGFLTHLSPFTPIRVDGGKGGEVVALPVVKTPLLYFKDAMKLEIHGGSNAVLVERSFLDDYYLAVFHTLSAGGQYVNYFMQFTTMEPFYPTAVSRPIPVINPDEELCPVFASGLTKVSKDHVMVTYGSCDMESRALTLSLTDVDKLFRQRTSSTEFNSLYSAGVVGVASREAPSPSAGDDLPLDNGLVGLLCCVGFVILAALFLTYVTPLLSRQRQQLNKLDTEEQEANSPFREDKQEKLFAPASPATTRGAPIELLTSSSARRTSD